MTTTEAKDILVSRIGWRDDKTVTGFTLSSANSTSDSGIYFQSEHSAITLQNIKDCQPIANIKGNAFNEFLENMKEQAVLQVLNDTLERDYLDDHLLAQYPKAFDTAISLRMVIIVGELIMTSIRSNRTKRFGDEFVGKLHYDIFREAPNKFAIRDANYQNSLGVSTRYRFEIQSIRRRFGNSRNMIKTITRGQVN